MPEHSLPAPDFDCCLLVRTDYSDDRAWQLVNDAIQTPSEEGFTAGVTIIENPDWEGIDTARLIAALPETYRHPLLIVSDASTQSGSGFPLLVTEVKHQPRRSMRVAAGSLWAVENNISIANLNWEDYANNISPDGIYREPE